MSEQNTNKKKWTDMTVDDVGQLVHNIIQETRAEERERIVMDLDTVKREAVKDAFAPFSDRRQSLIEPRGDYEALVIEFTTFEAARKAQERMWSVTPPETVTSSVPQVSGVMLSHARWFIAQALETMLNNVDGEPRSSMYVYDLLKKAESALDIPDIGYSGGD
jgi:hypothetical protein